MRTLLVFSVAAFAIFSSTMADDENVALRTVAQTTTGFANNFLKITANDYPGNLICSPLSAQVVLAMAAYGAGGDTATQMRTALLIPSDNALGQSGYQSLIETLNGVKGVTLRMANKIYTANQFPVKDAYKQITATKFLSTSQELDFTDAAAAAGTINAWCAEQTNDKIRDIITPDSLSSDTKLVLVNAVYFKGNWAKKFDSALTQPKPFHIDARTTKDVPTMELTHSFRTGNLPTINARFIELPYEGKELSMIIILPNEIDGLKTIQDNLHTIDLPQELRRTYPNEVKLLMPKFKIESTLNLKDPLEKMGMTQMFGNGADFSGMADVPLKVSKVIQKAFIEVNEEGSEAAAVTVMQIHTRRMIVVPRIFIDRPFIYSIVALTKDAEGKVENVVPLFTGYITDPESG